MTSNSSGGGTNTTLTAVEYRTTMPVALGAVKDGKVIRQGAALLAERGATDLEKYSVTPGTKDLIPDFCVDRGAVSAAPAAAAPGRRWPRR